jgi:hypothetical protein
MPLGDRPMSSGGTVYRITGARSESGRSTRLASSAPHGEDHRENEEADSEEREIALDEALWMSLSRILPVLVYNIGGPTDMVTK